MDFFGKDFYRTPLKCKSVKDAPLLSGKWSCLRGHLPANTNLIDIKVYNILELLESSEIS